MPAKSSASGDPPYTQFSFLVQCGGVAVAGFSECSGLAGDITVRQVERGAGGNKRAVASIKLPAPASVTLKRGVLGQALAQWLAEFRPGGPASGRLITLSLRDETRSRSMQTWKIHGAAPTKYTGPTLNAKGTDVAMEELTLAYERIEPV